MDFPRPYKVKEIAGIIDANAYNNGELTAAGLNELHVVRPGDVTFVDHPKYYSKVLNSDATVVIINKEMDAPEGKALVFHDAPFDAFIQLIDHFRPFEASHKSISPSARIGEGTVIQPGAFVGNNVVIGIRDQPGHRMHNAVDPQQQQADDHHRVAGPVVNSLRQFRAV